MKYIVTSFLSLCAMTTAHASQLENMKHSPATQYDLIRMDLKIVAYNLHQYLNDKPVGNSKFSFAGVDVFEDNKNIGLTYKYKSESKNIINSSCQSMLSITAQLMTPIKLTETLWPNFPEKQTLAEDIKIKTLLIPSDNPINIEYCD